AWARGRRGGTLPPLDLQHHSRVATLVRGLVIDRLVSGAHDVASGVLGLALAEMSVRSRVGFRVSGLDPAALGAESPSRAVLSVPPETLKRVLERAEQAAVPATVLGHAGEDRLVVEGLVDVSLTDTHKAWRDRLPAALGGGVTRG